MRCARVLAGTQPLLNPLTRTPTCKSMKKILTALLVLATAVVSAAVFAQDQKDYCEAETPTPIAYPADALAARQLGSVVLKLELGDDGQVRDVSVVSGHVKSLTDAAVAMAKPSIISCTEGWAGVTFEDRFDFDFNMKRAGAVVNRNAVVKRHIRPWALRPTEPVAAKWCEPATAGATPPTYPRAAMQAGVEGSVVVEAKIDSSGRAQDVIVSDSSGDESIDSAVTRYVRDNRFKCPTESRALYVRADFLLPAGNVGRAGRIVTNRGTMSLRFGK